MKLLMFAATILISAHLAFPDNLFGACCKYCSHGTEIRSVARAGCSLYCTVVECSEFGTESPNCEGGSFPCIDRYNDNCNYYTPCG